MSDKEFILAHNNKYAEFEPLHPVKTFNFNSGVVIGSRVHLGVNVIIQPNVTIYDDVWIGDDCVVDSGAVIGAPGFSVHLIEGKAVRLKQVGGVRIGDGCEIGANTCIDRASLEGHYTTIGNRVFIDNLCHIAHNVFIDNDTRIAPNVTIGGSTKIGERVWLSIGCSIKEHIEIGDDCFVSMNSIVTKNLLSKLSLNSFSRYKVTNNRERY